MKILGALTFFGGAALTYYGLFIHGSQKTQEEFIYVEPPKAPILLNDDRQVFTASGGNQTVEGNANNQNAGEVRGYPLPDNINGLKVDGNNQVMIITKQPAFGQEARGMFPVGVDFSGKKLVYKQNDGQLKYETYQDAKVKVILSDKKYLK